MKLTTIALALQSHSRSPVRSLLREAESALEVTSFAPSHAPLSVRQAVLQADPGILLGIRLLPLRMIQADQH